ncbi:MAG: CPBP family intramembrane metalloprotease [Chloroflexi bacterium]|nr:CPBP family intramembrane metalloprotease [Chloroflexota bacterium]
MNERRPDGEVSTGLVVSSAQGIGATPWSPGDVLRGSLVAVGLLLAGIIAVAMVALVAGVAGLDIMDEGFMRLLVFASMGLEGVFILPAWIWGPKKHRLPFRALGLAPARSARVVLLTVGGLAAILAVDVLWGLVAERFQLPGQPDLVPLFGEGFLGLLAAMAVAVVVAPFAEEVFFRGFMYAGFRARWGIPLAVIVSALVFSLFHLSLSTLVPILAMGAVFALLYERTGSLWPCIVLHALNNLIAVLGAYALA